MIAAVALAVALQAVGGAPFRTRNVHADEVAARQAGEARIQGRKPFAHVRRQDAFNLHWEQIDLAEMTGGGVAARRQTGSFAKRQSPQFTDSLSCPGLQASAAELDRAQSPPPELAIVDGAGITVWRPGDVDRTDSGGPLASWVIRLLDIAGPCWKPERLHP